MDHYSIFEPAAPENKQKTAPPEAGEKTEPEEPSLMAAPLRSAELVPEAQNERATEQAVFSPHQLGNAEPTASQNLPDLDAALQALVQKAQYISNANGAAIALRQGGEVVCRAASGSSAPDRGARLQIKSGLTAECLRTGELLRCDNVMSDPRVDLESCKRLAIESIIITPIRHQGKLAGVLELFSSHAYSFQERDVETVRGLAEEIGKLLDRQQEVAPVPPDPVATQPASAPSAAAQVVIEQEHEHGQVVCTNCGAKLAHDTVFCTECGFFQETTPGNTEAQPSGWKSRITRRRLLVPAAFVAMALLVAVAPIPRTGAGTAARTNAPTAQASLRPPVSQPIAQPVAPQAMAQAQAPAGAPAAESSSTPAANPSIAKSVKQLLGGVSSDFSKLLPVSEKAEPPSNGDPNLKVWVDTRKGFYYCPGDEQYGRTGKGSFMTQKEAESNYYIPALIKPCM
jgi:putative methionine-R-sulfoxide reductase with GAF domain